MEQTRRIMAVNSSTSIPRHVEQEVGDIVEIAYREGRFTNEIDGQYVNCARRISGAVGAEAYPCKDFEDGRITALTTLLEHGKRLGANAYELTFLDSVEHKERDDGFWGYATAIFYRIGQSPQ